MVELEAKYSGVIKLGEFELPCYVLNNETRVLSQKQVVKLITGGRESGNLGRYLDALAIQPHLPAKLQGNYRRNILIFKAGTVVVNGIEAVDVVDICKAYLQARQNGTLHPSQAKLAEQAEIFITACAKTGIDAIIDEATGYQYFRKANELQEKFKTYLQEEYREWTLTFPREFFMQLYKLEGISPPFPLLNYPKRFGKYVMKYIYDTLDPDIADFLRDNNPKPEGIKHHHQLFNDFGYNNLSQHLMSILGIMKASINLNRFNENIAIAFPNLKTQRNIRILKQREIDLDNENKSNVPRQMELSFDYIQTINTPTKQEKETYQNESDLTDFNKKLKKAIDYKTENSNKK
jgi:hypothetical protein